MGGENKGPPAGAGRELRCCAWGASSQNRGGRGVRPPGGSRLQPPRSQLLPRSSSLNLLGRLPGREPRGEPGEAGGSPPRDARGCRAGVEGAGVGAGSLRRAGVEAGGECCTRVCFPSWRCRHPETVLRPNFKQFKYLACIKCNERKYFRAVKQRSIPADFFCRKDMVCFQETDWGSCFKAFWSFVFISDVTKGNCLVGIK